MNDAYGSVIAFWGPIAIVLSLLYWNSFLYISYFFMGSAFLWMFAVFWVQDKQAQCPRCYKDIPIRSDPCPECGVGLIWHNRKK